MIKYGSPGIGLVAARPSQKFGALPEEEVARRQLVRDVIGRLDYNDIKMSMIPDRRRQSDASLPNGSRASSLGTTAPAPDVILPKIECILKEFRASEKNDSLRMRQIDLSLAVLGATKKKVSAGDIVQAVANEAKLFSAAPATDRLKKTS